MKADVLAPALLGGALSIFGVSVIDQPLGFFVIMCIAYLWKYSE